MPYHIRGRYHGCPAKHSADIAEDGRPREAFLGLAELWQGSGGSLVGRRREHVRRRGSVIAATEHGSYMMHSL